MIDIFFTLFATAIAVSCTIVYFFLKKHYRFWKEIGVPGPEPIMLLGNTAPLVKMEMTDAELSDVFYKQYSTEEYIGFYNLWKPVLLVRDLELVKRIMEKDFDYFVDRPGLTAHTKSDSVMINLFSLKGNVWKSRRTLFSKLFTPKKVKEYFDDMQHSLSFLMNDLEANLERDLKLNQIMKRHAIRTICMQLYGLDVSKDDERIAKFTEHSDVFSCPTASIVLKMIGATIAPAVFRLLKIPLFPEYLYEYYANLTRELESTRLNGNLSRNDLLEMIMKMKQEGLATTEDKEKMSFEEAVGHIYTFFQASFDTTELTICHTFLQLALHPEVQERAREEVISVLKESKTITYEHISEMNYLDAIVCETLRLYPTVGALDRVCTKPYKINDKLTIPVGMMMHIPVLSLQTDPDHYPEPKKFMPERFLDKESKNDAWIPFGMGPRICLGMRLAKTTVKLVLAKTLSEYVILPSEKMTLPMKFDPKTLVFSVKPLNGFWVKLKKKEQLP